LLIHVVKLESAPNVTPNTTPQDKHGDMIHEGFRNPRHRMREARAGHEIMD
jgi:hypothetical protein